MNRRTLDKRGVFCWVGKNRYQPFQRQQLPQDGFLVLVATRVRAAAQWLTSSSRSTHSCTHALSRYQRELLRPVDYTTHREREIERERCTHTHTHTHAHTEGAGWGECSIKVVRGADLVDSRWSAGALIQINALTNLQSVIYKNAEKDTYFELWSNIKNSDSEN